MRGSNTVPQKEKPVNGKLLSMKEAAEKSGMSTKWIYARMKEGTLPFPWYMASAGKRLIDSDDIENWLRRIKIPAGKMPGDIQGGTICKTKNAI